MTGDQRKYGSLGAKLPLPHFHKLKQSDAHPCRHCLRRLSILIYLYTKYQYYYALSGRLSCHILCESLSTNLGHPYASLTGRRLVLR